MNWNFKIVYVWIFFFCNISGYSQEPFQSVVPLENTIKSNDYPSSANERQILSSLSINNNKNIHQVRLNFKADLILNIQRDDQDHLYAYIKVVRAKVSGETYFRNFFIDTLLIPKVLDAKLIVWLNSRQLTEIPIEILLSGGVLDLNILEKYNYHLDELSFNVEVEKLFFTDQQLSDFMNIANLINSYYSYNEVLELLLKKYSGNQISRMNSSSETFIAWHHINRVNSFIATYDFISKLHLDQYDPLNFTEKYERSARLEERASTLFSKELEKGRKGKMLDRNAYGRKYTDISKYYIELSKKYQPNTVSGFNELVRIFPAEEDLLRVSSVAAFYDVFKITGRPSTTQLIYNSFVSRADSVLEKQEYLNALNLVRNAKEIEAFFTGVERSNTYSEVYANALNGLMGSFLKVSVMAYKSRNFTIAQRYYQQAQQIYLENAEFIGDDFRVKHSFREFVDKQVELAGLMLEDQYFEDAVSILDQAKRISEQNNLELNDIDFTTAYAKGYNGMYKTLVDSVEFYIEQENRKNSLSALLHSTEFEQSHNDYLKRDERLTSYSLVLFDDYFNNGLLKLHSDKPEKALPFLMEARKINDLFQMNHAKEIDSVVRDAILPVILQLIKKAEFEVWAKRLDEANQLMKEADRLTLTYNLRGNSEIESATMKFEEKLANRVCVSNQYKIDHACKISVNRIKSGKFEEARQELETAEALIVKYPDCDVNSSELDSLIMLYKPLFRYIESSDSLRKIIGKSSFPEIKALYDDLKNAYITNTLNTYLGELSSLYQLMKEEGNVSEYEQAVQYYCDLKEFKSAFNYLDLLRLNDVRAIDTKQYQKVIGYGICNEIGDKKNYIIDLTESNSWYKVLRASCLKN